MTSWVKAPALLLSGGLLLIQLAWVFVVPPYGAMDEVDHAYRAASVARGDWSPKLHQSASGRGDLISVPLDIVRAAHRACTDLKYTGYANCNPTTAPNPRGEVLVASAAARYNPLYYWIVGTLARPFTGATALFAMRLATALLSTLFITAAATIALRHSRTTWPAAGVLLCATPTLLDSTATAAPNGIEISAGLLMWSAGLALVHGLPSAPRAPALFAATALSMGTVVTLHTTGPLWALLFLCVAALVAPRDRLRELVRHRRSFRYATVATGLLTALALYWTLSHDTNSPSLERQHWGPVPWAGLAQQSLVWILQAVGGVPFRELAVPTVVFAIGLSLLILLMVSAVRFGSRPDRLGILLLVSLTIGLPIPLTIATFSQLGFAWQGRYTLPFAFGLPILCAWILDRYRPARKFAAAGAYLTAIGVAAMQAISLVNVRRIANTLPGGHAWAPPSDTLLIMLCAAGLALLGTFLFQIEGRGKQPAHQCDRSTTKVTAT